MGDGPVLTSEMVAALDELGVREPDERRLLLELWTACDAECLAIRKEKADARRSAGRRPSGSTRARRSR